LINLSEIKNRERVKELMDKGYATKGIKLQLEDKDGNKETVDIVLSQRGLPGPSALLLLEGHHDIMFVGAASKAFYENLAVMIPNILQTGKAGGGEQSE